MKPSEDFKKALSELPEKEKDKLILRLLKKDLALTKRLHFELLQPASVEDLRQETLDQINQKLIPLQNRFYAPAYAMMTLRSISGLINEHVSITKDKYGEIYLQLNMINSFLVQNQRNIKGFWYKKAYTLNVYIISRLYKLLGQLLALHEDLRHDFKEILEEIAENMGKIPTLMDTAIFNGFDVNWLADFEIPATIVEMQKKLRANGYLK